MIQPFANAQTKKPAAPTNGARHAASMNLFRELRKHAGHIALGDQSFPAAPAVEAMFLCEILFQQFMLQRGNARVTANGTERTPIRSSAANGNVTANVPYTLAQSFSNYAWDFHSPHSIQPWLLGYVYERWINQRASGSYFTPDALAYNIVQLALQEWLLTRAELELGRGALTERSLANGKLASARVRAWLATKLETIRVVDLSMGGGAFLVAAARALFELREKIFGGEFQRARALEQIFQNNLYGMDLAPEARRVAQWRLWLLGLELNTLDDPARLPPLPNLTIGDALAPKEPRAQVVQLRLLREHTPSENSDAQETNFDLCVGNPPFIALSQKSGVSNKAQLVEAWNTQHPQYRVTPTLDLSNFFILRGIERLNPGGVLAYITSRNFFDTRYGDPIRRYLTEQVDLRNVITLHDHPFTQLGIKVKANTVILSLIKRAPQTALHFHHLQFWNEPLQRANGATIARRALQTSRNWTNTLFEHPLRAELQTRCARTLGVYARVKMGVKSGCNAFFLVRDDSAAYQQLCAVPNLFVPAIKNSRATNGFLLPRETPYRFLNLYHALEGLEQSFASAAFKNPVAEYIFRAGIQYPCAQCQALAALEHQKHPERFPHRGMCKQCEQCKQNGACDRPVDRLSTRGHLPAWYTLSLGEPPLIAVQCIVDTEIGVFLNCHNVYVTDQFQVIDAPADPELGLLVFAYLASRVAHFLLEGIGLHRARYDGSFMLKIQVEHLRELPCPDLQTLPANSKKRLLTLVEKLAAQADRKSAASQNLRDELDRVFLEMLGYTQTEIETIQPALRAALEQAILFRWVKTRTRIAERESRARGDDNGTGIE